SRRGDARGEPSDLRHETGHPGRGAPGPDRGPGQLPLRRSQTPRGPELSRRTLALGEMFPESLQLRLLPLDGRGLVLPLLPQAIPDLVLAKLHEVRPAAPALLEITLPIGAIRKPLEELPLLHSLGLVPAPDAEPMGLLHFPDLEAGAMT